MTLTWFRLFMPNLV